MISETGIDQTSAELRRALEDAAHLAWHDVPGCDGVSVSLIHDGTPSTLSATQDRIRELDGAQYERGHGPCVSAMRDQEAVTVEDYSVDGRWPDVAEDALAAGIHSSLSIPLVQGRRTIGGLNMYGAAVAAFTEQSRRAAETFARQAALMLGYLQQLHVERAAHAREHRVATTLQRSLLPTLPHIEGITCAARYLVSTDHAQVGGDWYDLFCVPDGAIGIAVGDVMGHDVAAAAAMGQLRSVLRSYAYEGSSPAVVLDRLDRLVQGFDMADLATAIYGRLLLLGNGSGMFVFANAGHPPPLLRKADGTVSCLDRGASPLIGALPPGVGHRAERAEILPAGSLLLLYTDGLVETRDRDIDEGIGRISAALAAMDGDPGPEQVCDAVTAELVGADQGDDVALLAVLINDSTGKESAPCAGDVPKVDAKLPPRASRT
ncbi:MAG TPA: GAF domain-containing SpoIIE family protein phosphatase [Actinomycetales bacterium]|nr:GAF domain-containing SpoIIE family protein phosphatase [Actinomycetales bacterium]